MQVYIQFNFSNSLSLFRPLIAALHLREQFLLMVAMKLYSAQLRHQTGAMTARPHAATVTHAGMFSLQYQVFA